MKNESKMNALPAALAIGALLLAGAAAAALPGCKGGGGGAPQPAPAAAAPAAPAQPGDTAAQALYTCPMDPDVVSAQPGKCPKCGMFLEKKK